MMEIHVMIITVINSGAVRTTIMTSTQIACAVLAVADTGVVDKRY